MVKDHTCVEKGCIGNQVMLQIWFSQCRALHTHQSSYLARHSHRQWMGQQSSCFRFYNLAPHKGPNPYRSIISPTNTAQRYLFRKTSIWTRTSHHLQTSREIEIRILVQGKKDQVFYIKRFLLMIIWNLTVANV